MYGYDMNGNGFGGNNPYATSQYQGVQAPAAPSQMPWQQPNYQQPQMPQMQQSGGSNLASLIPLLSAYRQGVNGMQIGGQQNVAAQQGNIANAMMDTSNPLYQQLYGQNRQAMMQNLGNATSALQGQNRSLAAMGRVPLFSPERNGEMEFRNMTQGYANAGQQAGQQTMAQLQGAGQMYGNQLNSLTNVSQAQQQNKNSNLLGLSSLASALKLIGL